jgi:hypothetical protein
MGSSGGDPKGDPKGSGLYFFNFFRYAQTHRLTELAVPMWRLRVIQWLLAVVPLLSSKAMAAFHGAEFLSDFAFATDLPTALNGCKRPAKDLLFVSHTTV